MPATAGEPASIPVPAFRVIPVGRPDADHVYGGVPPVAPSCALYAAPTVALVRDVVVICKAAMLGLPGPLGFAGVLDALAICSEVDCVAVRGGVDESLT